MSEYDLAIRGQVSVALADGASPKVFNFSRSIKPASAILVATVSAVREKVVVQHGQIAATTAATSPQNGAITAVSSLARAHVIGQAREKRAGGSGVSFKLSSTSEVRMEWLGGALGGGEDIVGEFSVVEHRPEYQGARLRIVDEDTGEIAWDGGTLLATESITARYEVLDLENLGDDVKELLFRAKRILGYLGETMIQDLALYDTAGNPTSYRLRIFDTEANKSAAVVGIAAGSPLETGELGRVNVTAKYIAPKGDVLWRKFELEDVADNTDVT